MWGCGFGEFARGCLGVWVAGCGEGIAAFCVEHGAARSWWLVYRWAKGIWVQGDWDWDGWHVTRSRVDSVHRWRDRRI